MHGAFVGPEFVGEGGVGGGGEGSFKIGRLRSKGEKNLGRRWTRWVGGLEN